MLVGGVSRKFVSWSNKCVDMCTNSRRVRSAVSAQRCPWVDMFV